MNTAIILASGTGSRMKSDIPKQYLPLCGIPVYLYSVSAFVKNPQTDAAVVVVSDIYTETVRAEIEKYIAADKPVFVTEGGASRGQSLLKALEFCENNGLLDGIVMTHDSVRPFVTDEIIGDSIEKCRQHGAAIACAAASDTMFISGSNGLIKAVPDRSTVFHAQTPQTFFGRELLCAIRSLPDDVFAAMTDAGSVYAYLGKDVSVSLGSHDNIKITYPGDLPRAEITVKRMKLCQV